MTQDESQDCVGGLLERGLLTSCETGPILIFLVIFSIAEGFWGGSKPQTYCNGSTGKNRGPKTMGRGP